MPGYVASLRSGKVNGKADPRVVYRTPAIVSVHGDNGYAPLAIERGVPALSDAAKKLGVAVMATTHTHHFAALWPETEAIAEQGLIGIACVCYTPMVAPAGGNKPLFGTNPISFAWPRPGRAPMVVDMATASMALGEVQIAAREGHTVPLGTGLDANGKLTTEPNEILKGMLLPFGGYKGSAIALMVELLAAGAVGERFELRSGRSRFQRRRAAPRRRVHAGDLARASRGPGLGRTLRKFLPPVCCYRGCAPAGRAPAQKPAIHWSSRRRRRLGPAGSCVV